MNEDPTYSTMNSIRTYCHDLRTPDRLFNVSFIIMVLTMALLPFTTYLMWPFSILLMLLWIAQGQWRAKWENFKANDGIPYGIFLLTIFLIPILGLTNSTNTPFAWRTFECYLWFFFAPTILLTTSREILTKKHIHLLLGVFSASVILHILVLFTRGIYMATTTGDSAYLYYSTFSFLRHPTYVAIYTTFAYTLLFVKLIDHHDMLTRAKKTILYISCCVLLIGVFCLYSRAGIITFIAIHFPLAVYAVHRRKANWKGMLFVLSLIFCLFIMQITSHFAPKNRFAEFKYDTEQKGSNGKPDARLIIWEAAWEAAVENLPFGTGTGDCFDAIREKYQANGYWKDWDHNYNAHNQYLQALLTNGIPGIIILLLYFFTPFGTSVRHKDILLFILFVILSLNSLAECVFDRRFGVDFFALMIPLLMLRAMPDDNNVKHNELT